MPVKYKNTVTGRVALVDTIDEAVAKASHPDRARTRQKNLLEKLNASRRWVAYTEPQPQPLPVSEAPVRTYTKDDLAALVSDRASAADEPTRSEVRAWAQQNGHEVSPRGAVSKALIDAYKAAQAGE